MFNFTFKEGKEETKKWLRGEKVKTAFSQPPDENIRELLEKLNELPFLYTHASCGGHIRTEQEALAILGVVGQEDLKNIYLITYTGPWFSFSTDGSEVAEKFVEDLRRFLETYPDASFEKLPNGFTYAAQLIRPLSDEPLCHYQAQQLALEAEIRIKEIEFLVREYAK